MQKEAKEMTYYSIRPEVNTTVVYPFPLYAFIHSFICHQFHYLSNIYVPRTFIGLGDRQMNKTDKSPALLKTKVWRLIYTINKLCIYLQTLDSF